MYAEAIHQAVLQTYLAPLDALIQRKAKIHVALTARDPFAMTDEQAAGHHRRLAELAQEIELLGNLRQAVADLHETYNQRLQQAERAIAALQHDIQQVGLDYATFRQMFFTELDFNKFLLESQLKTLQHLTAHPA